MKPSVAAVELSSRSPLRMRVACFVMPYAAPQVLYSVYSVYRVYRVYSVYTVYRVYRVTTLHSQLHLLMM